MEQEKSSFALALSGGGVKGLAHIALLKKLDELGVRPKAIAGTSMGAIIGALYACGVSGREIEERVRSHIVNPGEKFKDLLKKHKHFIKWTKVFSFERSKGGLVAVEGLFEHLFNEIIGKDFEHLEIPFTAIATAYHSGQPTVLSTGNLLLAVKASMAVPGIFAPVEINNQLLVDGGLVNNVPFDVLSGKAEKIIASDVIDFPTRNKPSTKQLISGALQIFLCSSTQLRLKNHPVDLMIKPDTEDIDVFDFRKINIVLERGELAVQACANQLEKLIGQ